MDGWKIRPSFWAKAYFQGSATNYYIILGSVTLVIRCVIHIDSLGKEKFVDDLVGTHLWVVAAFWFFIVPGINDLTHW